MEGGRDWSGAREWLMVNGSSRMRVIIMTDVVYSHFPLHHLFCGGGKPSHSFLAHRQATSHARLEAFILASASLSSLCLTCALLHWTSLSPIFFSLLFFFFTFCCYAHLPPGSLFLLPFLGFHCCRVDTAVRDYREIGLSTCKMLTWCTAIYTGDDKLRLDAVILPFVQRPGGVRTHAWTHALRTHGRTGQTRVARLCVETNLFVENTWACMETDASS